jgi:O-antigen/teichoic acid export membrane protein
MGVWLNGLMYGVDFEPYRGAQYLMILAGGFSAAIDFLFQTITVLRRQAQATVTYLIAFVFVAIASMVLVRMSGFMGAVYSYTTVMIFLFIMLAIQFVLIRLKER